MRRLHASSALALCLFVACADRDDATGTEVEILRPLTLGPNVLLLDGSDVELLGRDATTVTLSRVGITPGTVLVSFADGGFVRRVVSVIASNASSTLVATEDAALTEAVEDFRFRLTVAEPGRDGWGEPRLPTQRGARLDFSSPEHACSVEGGQAELGFDVHIQPEIDLEVDIRRFHVERFVGRLTLQGDLTVETKLVGEGTIPCVKELAEIEWPERIVFVGSVPVTLRPYVLPRLELDAHIRAGALSVATTTSFRGVAGLAYDDATGFTPILSGTAAAATTPSRDVPAPAELGLRGKAAVEIGVELKLMGVVGPRLALVPEAGLALDLKDVTPDATCAADYVLDFVLGLEVLPVKATIPGFDVSWASARLSHSLLREVLAHGNVAFLSCRCPAGESRCGTDGCCAEGQCVAERCGCPAGLRPCGERCCECVIDDDCPEAGQVCAEGACVMDGALRFTLAWSAPDDFDLHVVTPSGEEIDYLQPIGDGGTLDRDDVEGGPGAVENVFFAAPDAGTYSYWVRNFGGEVGGGFTLDVFRMGVHVGTQSGVLPALRGVDSPHFTLEF
ncbi:MAG: hypothetical protein IT385_09030 [Deltaproteobacteria bacterium]|nr:hypothetical protein [Deltaproteobacteria bacterium]